MIKNEILATKIIHLEEMLSKYIRTYYHEIDTDYLMNLLKLSFKYYSKNISSDFHVRNSLEIWVNYLKNDNEITDNVRDELMKILSDKKFEEFSSAEQVLRMIKNKYEILKR